MSEQLTLGVKLDDDATFANYYAGDNALVIDRLQQFSDSDAETFIYLYGVSGVGKTHLLQAVLHMFKDQARSIMYLPLSDNSLSPSVLQEMELLDCVCLDDIDAVLGNQQWEEALFHFYNRMREAHTRLLVVGKLAPLHLKMNLPDLRSRLAWGLVLQLKEQSDNDKLAALQMRAHRRGLILTQEVAQFLLRHFPRDMHHLFAVLDKLDKASMVSKRRLTIPFVKEVLG